MVALTSVSLSPPLGGGESVLLWRLKEILNLEGELSRQWLCAARPAGRSVEATARVRKWEAGCSQTRAPCHPRTAQGRAGHPAADGGSHVPSPRPGNQGGVFVCSGCRKEEPGPGPPRPPVRLRAQVTQDRWPVGQLGPPRPPISGQGPRSPPRLSAQSACRSHMTPCPASPSPRLQ